jgi:hypothetical protein
MIKTGRGSSSEMGGFAATSRRVTHDGPCKIRNGGGNTALVVYPVG